MDKKRGLHYRAMAVTLIGFFAMLFLLNLMNNSPQENKKSINESLGFEVKKIKNRKKHKLQRRKKKQTRNARTKSLKPKLNIDIMNSGLELGIDILGMSTQSSDLLSQSGETIMTEDVVDQLPKINFREPIPYPESAKEKKLNGYVIVNILVNKKGDVEKINLVESQPEGVFDQIVLSSVRGWSFSPARYRGRMVSVWVKQKLKFQVN